jgi:rootletin
MLEGTEKELQRVQEQLAALRSEKEALEAVLFDAQSNLEASDVRVVTLEKEQQALMVTQEQLKGQVSRLTRDLENSEKRARETRAAMQQQAGTQEAEFQQTVSNLKKHNEETSKKLMEEKVRIVNHS